MYLKHFFSAVFVIVVTQAAIFAQQGGGFTLEQVLSSPFPSELTSWSKGDRIAWAFDAEGKRNIWVAEGPQYKARQLTRYNVDDGQELTDLAFSADGNWIVFVRGASRSNRWSILDRFDQSMTAV